MKEKTKISILIVLLIGCCSHRVDLNRDIGNQLPESLELDFVGINVSSAWYLNQPEHYVDYGSFIIFNRSSEIKKFIIEKVVFSYLPTSSEEIVIALGDIRITMESEEEVEFPLKPLVVEPYDSLIFDIHFPPQPVTGSCQLQVIGKFEGEDVIQANSLIELWNKWRTN